MFRAALLLLLALIPVSAQAHRNYSNPELAWTCKLGERALLCGMSIPARALERVLMRKLDFSTPPTADYQRALRTEMETLFSIRNAVTLDGQRVRPKSRSLTLLMDQPHGSLEDPALSVPGITLHQSRWALVRYVVSYPFEARPKTLTLTWDTPAAFTKMNEDGSLKRTDNLPGSLLIDGRWTEVKYTADAPTFTWQADAAAPLPTGPVPAPELRGLRLPLGSIALVLIALVLGLARRRWVAPLVCVGLAAGALLLPWQTVPIPGGQARAMDDIDRATTVFRALHANIYKAFDQPTEEAIYDTLAASVDGPLLDEIYTDVYESLALADDGGAVCKVEGVDLLEVTIEPDDDPQEEASFKANARWRLTGTVTHDGHRHQRTNVYYARYTVGLREAGWRLTAVTVLDLQRMATATQDVPLGDE